MKYSLEIKNKKAIETLEFNGKRYSKQYKEIDTSAVVTYDEDLSEQLAHNDEDDNVLDMVYETLEKGNLLNDLFDLAAYEKETGLVVDCRNYDNNRRYKCQAYTENHDACANCECNLARKAKWVTVPKETHEAQSYDHIECSACGYQPLADQKTHYCPGCGREMKVEEY